MLYIICFVLGFVAYAAFDVVASKIKIKKKNKTDDNDDVINV